MMSWSLPPTNVSSLPPWRRNTSRSPKVSVTSAHGALARVVAQQHPEQLADMQGIRLRSPEPSIHFDARRVHDHVRDPDGDQVPVQPEPVAARLVAAPHWGSGLQAEPLLGVGDLPGQPREIARRIVRTRGWAPGSVYRHSVVAPVYSAVRVALVIVGSSLPRFG